jgi:phage terminase small subunit
MKKLSRKEIKEGLETVPIETIILGSRSKQTTLTKKQKAFAEQVVMTGNKTEAYRRAYDTDGKRTTIASEANKVSKNPNVSTYIEALKAHKEVEEYLLPARLRALAIHKLSNMALNDDLKPTEQLRALELVGKMTEVALFTERRELVHTLDSASLKAKLMDAVQLAITNSKSLRTITKKTADDLLKEIQGNEESSPVEYVELATSAGDIEQAEQDTEDGDTGTELAEFRPPPSATTPFLPESDAGQLHSISLKESQTNGGEGSQNPNWTEADTHLQNTPIPNLDENGRGGI